MGWHAAEVEGTSITELTVAATMSHAIDVLADQRMFAIDDAAWGEFLAVLDRSGQPQAPVGKAVRRAVGLHRGVSGYSLPRPIAEDDDTSSFDSCEPSLDEYLRKRALGNHVQGASRCFVTCRDGRMVGYYALASASVQHGDVTGKVRRNMPDPVAVILLSRGGGPQGAGLRTGQEPAARCHPALGRGIRNHRRPGAARACAQTTPPAPSTPISTSSRHPPARCTCYC